MATLTTAQVLELTPDELWAECDHDFRKQFGSFVREFNKREWSVRIGKTHESFEDYVKTGYEHQESFGTGFVIEGRPIPYFHPNRSFHDEIIWLNNNLYYNPEVSFDNRLANSAIVKFYGPSRTLSIITGQADDLPYLVRTEKPYIDFERLKSDREYEYTLLSNINLASANKESLWGTTELRTSLQIAARNHARTAPSVYHHRSLTEPRTGQVVVQAGVDAEDRKMRPSDMIVWIKSLADEWSRFYKTKPTMKESYEYLTEIRGIGPYYGYHFSSNLARMPGVGHGSIIQVEHAEAFESLNISHGALDEDADYVVAGPGASATLKCLFPTLPINSKTTMAMILMIRDQQQKYLDISSEMDYKYLSEATELGRFTTFGVEIACCQFNVFNRLKDNAGAASARANAPISKEVGSSSASLENFFG